MNEQISDFDKFREKYFEKIRQEKIIETGIDGYCPCCGAPHYVGKEHEHDMECIWYDD